ncbi:MAG: biotin--[acetyl-CoA-carboxylase] ligase [candidate division WOR-3 bacterium]
MGLPYRILTIWSNTITPRIGHKIYSFLVLTSTNDEALKLAKKGAKEGTIVISRIQTKGRGRGENIWYSEPGGLYISIILRPNLSREELLPFSLVIANSVAKAIETVIKVKIGTKWINDLIIDNKKVGGILVETEGETEKPDFLIAGIGVNVNQTHFPNNDTMTSLRLIVSQKISRWQLVKAIGKELEKDYPLFLSNKFSPFREEYKSRCAILNKAVSVIVGSDKILGKVIDIDEKGRLILLTSNQKLIRLTLGRILREFDPLFC